MIRGIGFGLELSNTWRGTFKAVILRADYTGETWPVKAKNGNGELTWHALYAKAEDGLCRNNFYVTDIILLKWVGYRRTIVISRKSDNLLQWNLR